MKNGKNVKGETKVKVGQMWRRADGTGCGPVHSLIVLEVTDENALCTTFTRQVLKEPNVRVPLSSFGPGKKYVFEGLESDLMNW